MDRFNVYNEMKSFTFNLMDEEKGKSEIINNVRCVLNKMYESLYIRDVIWILQSISEVELTFVKCVMCERYKERSNMGTEEECKNVIREDNTGSVNRDIKYVKKTEYNWEGSHYYICLDCISDLYDVYSIIEKVSMEGIEYEQ